MTGYGLIDVLGGKQHYIASGVIRSSTEASMPERLHTIFSALLELTEQYQPHLAVVEKIFVNINPQSTLLLGQARGAALTALTHRQIAVVEYTALQIKQALVGNGKANKEQVQEMVKRLLNLPQRPSPDAADALAAAITHAQSYELLQQLAFNSLPKQTHQTTVRKGRTSWK